MNERVHDLDYYLGLPYSIKIYPASEGGYVVEVEELPGCITQVEEFPELPAQVEDVKRAGIDAALEDGERIPLPDQQRDYSGKLVVRMPRSLHRALAHEARSEKVSLNQLITCTLSRALGERQLAIKEN